VAGYKRWQSLGRQVLKGQRGYQILAPVTQRWAAGDLEDPGSWRRLGFKERPKPGEAVRSRIVGVKPAHVWDVSQTEGEPVPERPRPRLLEGEAPAGLWDGLAGLVAAAGFTLSQVADAREVFGANGVTDHVERTVKVRADMDPAARVKTLAHELAHVRMHGPAGDGPRVHRGVGEVEAESVAMMIGAAHGMPTDDYTVPYVSSWAATVNGRTPAEAVRQVGERVRAEANAILDALDTVQVGAGDPPGLDRAEPGVPPAAANSAPVGPVSAAEPAVAARSSEPVGF
jgi:hypothetical protein